MKTNKIDSEIHYKYALSRIWDLMHKKPTKESREGKELNMLLTLVEAYEAIHYPIPVIDPIELLKKKMKEKKLKQTDLIQYIGSKSQVSKILHRKQNFTVKMIRNLSKGLNIPVGDLIG